MSQCDNLNGHLVTENVVLDNLSVALASIVGHENLLAPLQRAVEDVPETGPDQIHVAELPILRYTWVNRHSARSHRVALHIEADHVHVAAGGGGQCRVRRRWRWTEWGTHEGGTARRAVVRRLDVLDDASVVETVGAEGADTGPDNGPLGETLSRRHFDDFRVDC